jgi:hypothetical protein
MIYKPVVVLDRLPAPNRRWVVNVCSIKKYVVPSIVEYPYFFLTDLTVLFKFQLDLNTIDHSMGRREQLGRLMCHLDYVHIEHPFGTLYGIGI